MRRGRCFEGLRWCLDGIMKPAFELTTAAPASPEFKFTEGMGINVLTLDTGEPSCSGVTCIGLCVVDEFRSGEFVNRKEPGKLGRESGDGMDTWS